MTFTFVTAFDTVVARRNGLAPFSGLPCAPLVTHADGSLVMAASPAKGGEEVVAYAAGVGLTNPAISTGQAATTATPTYEIFYLDFDSHSNALATKRCWLQRCCILSSGHPCIPVWCLTLPDKFRRAVAVRWGSCLLGQCNLTVSVGGQTSFDGAGICVAP